MMMLRVTPDCTFRNLLLVLFWETNGISGIELVLALCKANTLLSVLSSALFYFKYFIVLLYLNTVFYIVVYNIFVSAFPCSNTNPTKSIKFPPPLPLNSHPTLSLSLHRHKIFYFVCLKLSGNQSIKMHRRRIFVKIICLIIGSFRHF